MFWLWKSSKCSFVIEIPRSRSDFKNEQKVETYPILIILNKCNLETEQEKSAQKDTAVEKLQPTRKFQREPYAF